MNQKSDNSLSVALTCLQTPYQRSKFRLTLINNSSMMRKTQTSGFWAINRERCLGDSRCITGKSRALVLFLNW